jgi:hypothetical protein
LPLEELHLATFGRVFKTGRSLYLHRPGWLSKRLRWVEEVGMSSDGARMGEVNRLQRAAGVEAAALGDGRVGSQHFLLAILASGEESIAATALRQLGIAHDALARRLAGEDEGSESASEEWADDVWTSSLTAGAHELVARAEGLAAGLGALSVTVEHVLTAYVWSPWTAAYVEEFFGVTHEAIFEQLRVLGVRLPSAPLPPRPRPTGARVYVPYGQLMEVVRRLGARLPTGYGPGFNHDGQSQAWVIADREIDLERHVREVLRELALEQEARNDGESANT